MKAPDSGSIEEAAAGWLALRDQRDLTPAEQASFDAWLAADTRNSAAVKSLSAAWSDFDRLRQYPRPAEAAPDPDFFARPRRFHAAMPLALAAAAAIAVAVAVATLRHRPTRPENAASTTFVVQANESRSFRLSDHSQVKLNAGSEILEQFTPEERRVQLVRGEAHFAVTKNPARPFVVQAGPVAVRAVGTAFDVRLNADMIEVLVTEGKVRLDPPAGSPGADGINHGHSSLEYRFLEAGQRATIRINARRTPAAPVVENLAPREIERALAWQTGRFIFDATPLSVVVGQFNSRNAQHLRLIDPQLGALRISGTFKVDDVDSFVQLLELGFHVEVDRQTNGEIVLRRVRADQQ